MTNVQAATIVVAITLLCMAGFAEDAVSSQSDSIVVPSAAASPGEKLRVLGQARDVVVRHMQGDSPGGPVVIPMTDEERAALRNSYAGAVIPLESDVVEWHFSLLAPPKAEQATEEWQVVSLAFHNLMYTLPDSTRLEDAAKEILVECTLPERASWDNHRVLVMNAVDYLARYADKDDLSFLRELERPSFWEGRVAPDKVNGRQAASGSGENPVLRDVRGYPGWTLAKHKPEEAVAFLQEILSRSGESPEYKVNSQRSMRRAQRKLSGEPVE